jgi:hypothetical protein
MYISRIVCSVGIWTAMWFEWKRQRLWWKYLNIASMEGAGRSKMKGRCLLDSFTYGAHYGGYAMQDMYHLSFGRWDHDFEHTVGSCPATCRCFIRVPPYACLKNSEAQITGIFRRLVLCGVAERMELNGPYKVRESVNSTAPNVSILRTRLWSCWKLPWN